MVKRKRETSDSELKGTSHDYSKTTALNSEFIFFSYISRHFFSINILQDLYVHQLHVLE